MRTDKSLLLIIVIGLALRLVFLLWSGGTMVDDAYIYLRYAQNFVEGRGLVYNEGQHVQGITGPLYVIWISFLLLFSPLIEAGYAIGIANILLFALSAIALFSLVSEMGRRPATLALLIFACFLRFADNSTVGMETPLFLLGIVGSLLLLRHNRLSLLSLVLASLVLVRPEGIFWILSVLAVLAVRRQIIGFRHVLPGLAVLLLWTTFSVSYYGSPIPQSVQAKSGWFVPESYSSIYSRIISTFASLSLLELPNRFSHIGIARIALVLFAIVASIFFAFGTVKAFRERSVLFAFPVLFVIYVLSYIIGKGRLDYSWYGIPSGFAYVVTSVVGVGSVVSRIASRQERERWFRIIMPSAAFVLIFTSIVVWYTVRSPAYEMLRESYEKAGEFVDLNARDDARILTAEIGMIGYRSKRFVYDMGGIVSPEVMDYFEENDWNVTWPGILMEFEPDLVVFDLSHLDRLFSEGDVEWVKTNYRVAAEFPIHKVLKRVH